MKSPTVHFLAFLLFLCSCGKEDNMAISPNSTTDFSEEQVSVLEAIHQNGVAINPNPLAIRDAELSILNEIGEARIVGLGEATHGTKEFFQMKHRIFQYLVENHGFDAFLFEIDMAEARIFNDWVQWRRDDDLTKLMADNMLFWVWHTAEVRDLLEYMRTYNQGKPESDMIGFYGVDTQFPTYDLTQLVEILQEAAIPEADSVLLKNKKYQALFELYRDEFSDALVAEVITGIKYAKQVVIDNEQILKNTLGERQWLWAQQLALHMEQVQQVHFDATQNNRYYQRDQYMADNTQWFFELLGADSKFVLWAHNGHLANDATYGGIYGGSQGNYLKKEYDSDYQIIGFSFAMGSFSAVEQNGPLRSHTIGEEPIEISSNFLLYHSSLDNFILPLNTMNTELDNWLGETKPFLSVGAVFNGNVILYYRETNLKELYDYLVHFDVTNNSVLLSR